MWLLIHRLEKRVYLYFRSCATFLMADTRQIASRDPAKNGRSIIITRIININAYDKYEFYLFGESYFMEISL